MKKRRASREVRASRFIVNLNLAIFILYFALMGWSSDFILGWFGKNIPFIGDMFIGLFAGAVTIPVAVVGWILQLFGVF